MGRSTVYEFVVACFPGFWVFSCIADLWLPDLLSLEALKVPLFFSFSVEGV